jgi:hypothetical protein
VIKVTIIRRNEREFFVDVLAKFKIHNGKKPWGMNKETV